MTLEGILLRAESLADRAAGLATLTRETYENAGPFLSGVKTLEKEIQAHYAPLKQAAHTAHRKIVDAEREMLAPLVEAERIVKRAIVDYESRLQREREAEQRRIDEDAAIDGIEPIAVPAMAKPKTAGVSTRETWTVEVDDLRALARAVADGIVPAACIAPVAKELNGLASRLTTAFAVPGCRAVRGTTVAARAA